MPRKTLTPVEKKKRAPEAHFLALEALRIQANSRYFPQGTAPITDASAAVLPRIVAMEAVWRSRIIEELAAMQMLLVTELMRPDSRRRPDSLAATVREIRGLITDQVKMVEKTPVGMTSESAKGQVRDLLERHQYLASELRRRGLESLLEKAQRRPSELTGELPAVAAALMGIGSAAPEPPAAPHFERSPDLPSQGSGVGAVVLPAPASGGVVANGEAGRGAEVGGGGGGAVPAGGMGTGTALPEQA
jgi:hypothetical protein